MNIIFLKNRKFRKFFKILNEIFKFFFLINFIMKNKIQNLKIDPSSLVICYFISKFMNLSFNLRLYGSYTLNFQRNKKDLYSYFFRCACKMKFNSIICTKDGNSDHNNIKKIFTNTKKIKVSFNGSNFKNYKSRMNYNLNSPLNVLFVGRLNQLKGPMYLLKAINKLKIKNIIDINLTIIGNGEQKEKILRYVRVNNLMSNFRFYRKLNHIEIRNKMRNSDILVSPSFIGYFSNVVLEATSMGLPVMTCRDKYNTINNFNFNYLQNKYSFKLSDRYDLSDQIYNNLIKIINNPNKLYQMSSLERTISKKKFKNWKQKIDDEIELTNFK